VDVLPWRLRGAPAGEPLRLRLELATTSNPAVAAALAGTDIETFTAAATIEIPVVDLLRASASADAATWFPRGEGEWYTLSPPGHGVGVGDASVPPPRVRLRARAVEGLDLRPMRLARPGRCCMPRHMFPFNSINEGLKRVG